MKKLIFVMMALLLIIHPEKGKASTSDTVVIELNNRSKIVVYTEDRVALKDLEQYDLNKMIKDLNSALRSSKIEKIELQDDNGKKYLKDTTIIFGEGSSAKTKIKIGNMELLVDADEWEDLDDEWDDDLPVRKYHYEEESIDRTRHYFNIDFGLNNWMEGNSFPDENNEPYAVKPWGSWYFGLNSVNRTWISGPLFLDWGMGVSWYNWKMQEAATIIEKGDTNIEFNAAPASYSSIKSKLTAPYLNVTMVPMLDFAKGRRKVKNLERGSISFRTYKKQGIRFGAGGYAGYRLGGSTKYVYTENNKKEKNKNSGNYYLSNFRYGIRAQVGYKGLDLFAMYDLNEVFASGRGPAGSQGMNAITFGITL
ncbi:hypothetical protein [Marinoscillum sp.]|uniref:hypothetical protein n=1 Tax=Marinoscillum sp. TaxID=2024838 RepID=UPI003BAC2EDC